MNVTKYLNVTLLNHGNGYFLKGTEEQCIVIQVFPPQYSCVPCVFKFSSSNEHYKITEATMSRESPFFHGTIYRYAESSLKLCDKNQKGCLQKGNWFDFPRVLTTNDKYESLSIRRKFINQSLTTLTWYFDLRAINWMEIIVRKFEESDRSMSSSRFAYDFIMGSRIYKALKFRESRFQIVSLKLGTSGRRISRSTKFNCFIRQFISFPYLKTLNHQYGKFTLRV